MWHDGNSAGALLILERVLADGSGEMKRVALMLAGMIKEGEGDYEGAANDWSRGLSFSSENPFVKFQLELNLGRLAEKSGNPVAARDWYLAALKTCLVGDGFSGVEVVSEFWSLTEGSISDEERALVSAVVEISWSVHEIIGEPDLRNLGDAISRLKAGLKSQIEAIHNATELDG